MLKVVTVNLALVLGLSMSWAFTPMPHERTKLRQMRNSMTGRYLYLGDVPKFKGEELELTISKMALTARVRAHVSEELKSTYAQTLFQRWKLLDEALKDRAIGLHPLIRLEDLASDKGIKLKQDQEVWIQIVKQYARHILEGTNGKIYRKKRNLQSLVADDSVDEYKKLISETYFKYLFDSVQGPNYYVNDQKALDNLLSSENSQKLFHKHLGRLFTKSQARSGYVGYLTLVYPIAATTEGPFSQPKQGTYNLLTANSLEARAWSTIWKDEFGGMPFLLIDWSGVAFHGPITSYKPLDVWFLRRGFVSHGCHRMDPSDLLELRALMPYNLKAEMGKIKVTVLDYFDVTDWDQDGELEVMDVKYYTVPARVVANPKMTVDELAAPYSVEEQQKKFFLQNNFAKKYYDAQLDRMINAPKYVWVQGKLGVSGMHPPLPIHRFEYRPARVIQYVEEGVSAIGLDDDEGNYPPQYFHQY